MPATRMMQTNEAINVHKKASLPIGVPSKLKRILVFPYVHDLSSRLFGSERKRVILLC